MNQEFEHMQTVLAPPVPHLPRGQPAAASGLAVCCALVAAVLWAFACDTRIGNDKIQSAAFDSEGDQPEEVMQSDAGGTFESPPDNCGVDFDVSQMAGSAVVTAYTTSSYMPTVYQVWFFGSDGMTMEIPGLGLTLPANHGLVSGLPAIGPLVSRFVIRANCTGREVRWAIVRLMVQKCATARAVALSMSCN